MSNYHRPPRSSSGNRDRQAGRRTTSTSGRSLGQHASRSDARSAQRSGRHGASSSRESSRGRRAHQAPAPAGIAGKLAIFDSNRAFWPLAIFAIFAAVFFLRLVYLQVIVAGDYSAQAQAQRTSYLTIEPRRGTIYDRNGVVLATSVDATTIYVDPTEVTDVNMTAQLLADSLGGQASDYLEKVTANNTRYSVIKRKADTSVGDDLQSRVTERVAEAQKQENARAKDAGEQAQTVQSGIHFVTESRR